MSSCNTTILLRPRPYERFSGSLLLLPLLPEPKPVKPLPAEIWSDIIAFALGLRVPVESETTAWSWSLLKISKSFHDITLPLLYASVHFTSTAGLEKFTKKLYAADQKWDSIRRIPYSTPGRWVQTVDLSSLVFEGQAQALLLDSLLTQLFPLVPFLSTFSISPSFVLSRRALSSLVHREGAVNIRSLSGLSYIPTHSPAPDDDPFVQLLRSCPNLEVLEIVGQGLDLTELEFDFTETNLPPMITFSPLALPKLRLLTLLSMHYSPLMLALLHSPLPVLRKLTVTPFEDIPYPASLVSEFITTHGADLYSLLLFTPKSWPTRLRPSPTNLLMCTPNLNHLSLEMPLPNIVLTEPHHLKILSIPRPNAEFWRVLERLFPLLPHLAVIRTRDVRWLRKGISSMAQEAGVQGEMREWKRRLDRRRIRLLDADWRQNV
ncbi:unnamed protein product [Cyclocybe aegerita]|uniref:F-box domain-containing protein n=1 Tax=Cyclocybe aegerita TaxID=1973307 RepID=A0A8S0XXT3_CYCAE|nr:unnamed protein product [Cyclocybe aegerita]